jgi:chemotaxis regulatin CheY-phosphate phosphatase CheZ|tara:strand:- start:567 stop:779 length:213 start_codon:yes stop_codon:yes gene_type:complete
MAESIKITPDQEYIMSRHSKMVGKVLDLIEASMPEGNQCEKMKKLIQQPLYDYRNEMLKFISDGQKVEDN